MADRRPQASFEVRFIGPQIKPEVIPLRVLARALSAVQRLMSDEELDEDTPTPGRELHLLDVKRGSATYPVFADKQSAVLERLSLTGRVLEKPEMAEAMPQVLSPIEELSAIAKSLQCTIEFKRPGPNRTVLATIRPDSYESIAGCVFVDGETSIAGKVERVGGATELRCGLRVRQQPDRMLICRVESADVARELGQHLYEEVVVNGIATWFRKNWRIKTFLVRSTHQVKRGSIIEAMHALRAAGGSAWDRVADPRRYLQEVRGE